MASAAVCSKAVVLLLSFSRFVVAPVECACVWVGGGVTGRSSFFYSTSCLL